jgi:Protein of unknown function (DUF732)
MTVDRFRPVIAAAAALLLAAATAHADSVDDQFLATRSQDGLNIGPPDQLIAVAHQRCDDAGLSRSGLFIPHFGEQPSPFSYAIANIYNELESQGMTSGQVVHFMQDAMTCTARVAHRGNRERLSARSMGQPSRF